MLRMCTLLCVCARARLCMCLCTCACKRRGARGAEAVGHAEHPAFPATLCFSCLSALGPAPPPQVLEELRDAHPVVPIILEHRHTEKRLSSFLNPLMQEMRTAQSSPLPAAVAAATGRRPAVGQPVTRDTVR